MKTLWIGLVGLIFSTSIFAQVCTPSAGNFSGIDSGTSSNPYDTCTATDQLTVSCSGLNPIGTAKDAIWSIAVGPGEHSGNLVILTTTPTYDLYVGLMSGSCSAGSPCVLEADSSGAGGTEVLGPFDNLANGTYYLLVTTFFGTPCGSVTIQSPNLPAVLTRFTID